MPSKNAPCVLVCDDNKDAADSLSLLLECSGFEVSTAYTGHKAVAMAEATKPQMALLDIGLPDLNGFEVAKSIRAQPFASNMLIVAISGYGTGEDKQKAFDAGFDYHFTKPISSDQLDRLLDALEEKCRKGVGDVDGSSRLAN